MKTKIILFFVTISFSISFSQNPCPAVGGCNYGNNFQAMQQFFYVNTDSVSSITDTSAILYGWASSSDANCNSGSAIMKVTSIAAWSTNCSPVCYSNLSALNQASFVYENTNCAAWVNNKTTSIKLTNLTPNTTYYVRYIVMPEFPNNQYPPSYHGPFPQPYPCIGNIKTFKTKQNSAPPITNNIITSGNQNVLCSQSTGIYSPAQITASLPTGGRGSYTYLWQRSADAGKTWQPGETTSGNNTSQNYQPSQHIQAQTPLLYRRIVTAGNQSDTSKYATLTFVDGIISIHTLAANLNPGNSTANVNISLTVNQKDIELYSSGICWSTSPNPSYNWNNPVAGTYANTPVSPNTYLMQGLLSNTIYYVRAYAFEGDKLHNYQYFYGAVLSFATGVVAIGNNYITGNQILCQTPPASKYVPAQFNGTLPTGGNGTYSYLWIISSNGGKTWQSANNTSQNFQPAPFTQIQTPPVLYRRIVTSGTQKDTSSVVSITFVPANYYPNITITQIPYKTNDVLLSPSIDPPLGNFSVQWQNSISGGVFTNINSLSNGDLLIPVATSPVNSYQAIVTYGSGCPNYPSTAIGISAPDGNGNIYPTVTIGVQTWMISNLRTTKFNGGMIAIPKVVSNSAWQTTTGAAYCWYNNDSISNAIPYGALYNQYIINYSNVCPMGWRLATPTDWSTLTAYVSGSSIGITTQSGAALKKINAAWQTPNFATNRYNFNALPGGERKADGTYFGKMTYGYWLTLYFNVSKSFTTPSSSNSIIYQLSNSSNSIFYNNSNISNMGYSIRCIQNPK